MAQYKDNLLGEANSFLEVLEQVSRLAPLDKPVLVIGERGTGKELIANRLHYLSSRWQGPFISLNCAALNDNLLDSGAVRPRSRGFTGASKRHPGRFERADGGTLFLDELATAPMLVQEKLLRVIEYGELERVGGSQPLQVNVRLVCATNADLPQMVEEGHFAPTCSTAWPSTWYSSPAARPAERHHVARQPVCHPDVPRTRSAAVSRL